MTPSPMRYRHAVAAVVCLSVILGGWLRFSGLEKRSITHPEMYVPGIPLPEGLSEPAERVTFSRILSGTFSSDTHPPGYYLLMLPWTREMGTSLRAIRLPSAFFGLACIPLIFCLGALAGRRLPGALAAVFLAASGYHVFWSQVARMFALACFLGLAASVLLLLIARDSQHRSILTAVYVVLILAGVATHVFFWSLFAIHIIWAFGNARGRPDLPCICRAQLCALVLGSPLIAFAAYQSGNTVAELSNNIFLYLAEFLPFAFALPTNNSGFFASAVPFTGTWLSWTIRGVMLLIALFMLARALRVLWQSPSKNLLMKEHSPASANVWWRVGWIAAAVVGTAEIGAFLYLVAQLPPEQVRGTLKLTKALFILPFTLAAGALLIEWLWSRLPVPRHWERFLKGECSFLALVGTGPLLLLALLAQLRPILNQRGLLFLSPYLLLLLAIGMLTLRKAWIVMLSPILAGLFVASLASYGGMSVDPADYTRFAASLQSEVSSTDLVFIRKAWYETPILYYLRRDKYHLVGRNYASFCTANPAANVWVVLLYDSSPTGEMQTALSGYEPVKTITGFHTQAILYKHPQVTRSQAGWVSQTFEELAVLSGFGGLPSWSNTATARMLDLARGVRDASQSKIP
jgi:hypothetical protein